MSFDKLPDHFMLEVFKKLCTKDLLRVRLVCRNWAAVVSDSTALRRNYSLYVSNAKLDNKHPFIQTFTNSRYNICTNISFRNVFYDEADIKTFAKIRKIEVDNSVVIKKESDIVTRLWSKIGDNIECLRIEMWSGIYSKSTQHNWLILLLENTPNLVKFEINSGLVNIDFSESLEVTSDLNLKKLKTVSMLCWNNRLNIYLMKILTKSANGLTSIEFKGRSQKEFHTLYFLIKSQRHSLRELKLVGWFGKENLQKYLAIDNLSLEVLHLGSVLDKASLELLGKHKNLRDLKIKYLECTENHQYLTYLPKLEKLELCIGIAFDSSNESTPFPNNFKSLKSLKLRMDGFANKMIAFENPSICRTVEVLEISNRKPLKILPISILSIIDSYPNLRILKFNNLSCDAQSVDEICNNLVHLEELELCIHSTRIATDRNAFRNVSKLSKLKRLSVEDYIHICDDTFFIEHLRLPSLVSLSLPRRNLQHRAENITNQGISGLIDNCPLLEVLHLEKFDGITDASVAEILEGLVHLRELSISGQNLSRTIKFKN